MKQNRTSASKPTADRSRQPTRSQSEEGTYIEPGTQGGTNWFRPPSVPGPDCSTCRPGTTTRSSRGSLTFRRGRRGRSIRAGRAFRRGGRQARRGGRPAGCGVPHGSRGYGAVRAIDPKTGEKKWDFKMVDYTESGILTTAWTCSFREAGGALLRARCADGRAALEDEPRWNHCEWPDHLRRRRPAYVAVAGEGALYVFGLPVK